MASFAYNSAMSDQKLERKPAAPAVTNIFPALNVKAELDVAAFRRSGYGFSICGQGVDAKEIPSGFPIFLAVPEELHGHPE